MESLDLADSKPVPHCLQNWSVCDDFCSPQFEQYMSASPPAKNAHASRTVLTGLVGGSSGNC